MTERLQNWWIGLSLRERWLVGIAGVLALGVMLWGIGRPMVAAFIDLESRHRAAVEREGRVSAKVQLLAQRPAKSLAAAVDAVAIDQYLAQSASEIGLTLDRNEARGAGAGDDRHCDRQGAGPHRLARLAGRAGFRRRPVDDHPQPPTEPSG